MKKEYLKPELEFVIFAIDEAIAYGLEGEESYVDIEEGWE